MSECQDSAAPTGTPVLDSGVLPPRSRRQTVVGTIFGLVQGLILAFLLIRAVGDRAFEDLDPVYSLLLFFSAFILCIAVHEMGHLVAGWALGFRFSFVSVGPFSLRLEHGMLKVRFHRDMPALGYAGMHLDGVRRMRRRMLIYIAAGPTANLLSIPVTVLLVNHAFPRLGNSWVATPAAEFAVLSLFFGAVSLVPFGRGSFSDGARIAMLLGSRERTRRWVSTIAVGSQMNNGTRPKLWRKTWLSSASALRDTSMDEFWGNWVAYLAANDRKEAPVAGAHLERCLELTCLLRPSVRDLVAQEAAVFAAWFRSDAPLADKWTTQVKKQELMTPLMQIRKNVALRCAHRDFGAALSAWQDGATLIERLPVASIRERLVKSWLEWRTEIEERQNLGAAESL